VRTEIDCVFDPRGDKRKDRTKRKFEELEQSEKLLGEVLEVIRNGNSSELESLLNIIRQTTSNGAIVAQLDDDREQGTAASAVTATSSSSAIPQPSSSLALSRSSASEAASTILPLLGQPQEDYSMIAPLLARLREEEWTHNPSSSDLTKHSSPAESLSREVSGESSQSVTSRLRKTGLSIQDLILRDDSTEKKSSSNTDS
jgi:hypothetical protein